MSRGSPATRTAAAPRRELGARVTATVPVESQRAGSGMFANLAAKASKGVVGAREELVAHGWSLKPWLIPLRVSRAGASTPLTPEFKGDIKRRITDEDG